MIHTDNNIGVNGIKTHWMRAKDGRGYWCRTAIAIMGGFNMPFDELMRISPFDPRFNDNYVEGKGKTKEEALANMNKDMQDASDVFWSF